MPYWNLWSMVSVTNNTCRIFVPAYAVKEAGEKKYAEGKQKGREEGKHEGIVATARKMKAKGCSIEEICEITELSIAEVEKL